MMGALDEDVLRELREVLESRERELIVELSEGQERASGEQFARLAGEVPDTGDASVADTVVDTASAERERDSAELKEVREALARMDAGTYGLCLQCGAPIPVERLRASPYARYDVAHQEALEQGAVKTPTL